MKKQRTNKLYNYLVNTYGLSKEMIMEYVEERLEDLIKKHLDSVLRSNRVENMIMNRIAYYIKEGKYDQWHNKGSFEDVVDQQIRQVVVDQLKSRASVTFNFSSNSVDFIKDA